MYLKPVKTFLSSQLYFSQSLFISFVVTIVFTTTGFSGKSAFLDIVYGKSAAEVPFPNTGAPCPPLQRGAESSPPTLKLHFYFSIGTVKTVPYNFSLFIFHYSSIFGSSSYGCAITPLSLRDISPNRGISPTPTLALLFCA